MKTLLDKVAQAAGMWLNVLDNQLRQPIVKTLTGEVFTDGTTSDRHDE